MALDFSVPNTNKKLVNKNKNSLSSMAKLEKAVKNRIEWETKRGNPNIEEIALKMSQTLKAYKRAYITGPNSKIPNTKRMIEVAEFETMNKYGQPYKAVMGFGATIFKPIGNINWVKDEPAQPIYGKL